MAEKPKADPAREKPDEELTNEEAARKLFPKGVLREVERELAAQPKRPKAKRG